MGKTLKEPQPTLNTLVEQIAGRVALLHHQNPARARAVVQHVLSMFRLEGDDEVRKTYTVDLKVDFDDPERHKIALHMVRKVARQLLTQVTLIADNRQPQVGITCDDFFEGGSQEGLMDLPEKPEDAGDGVVDK